MDRYPRQNPCSTLPPGGPVRIVLFGLDCAFTLAFLKALTAPEIVIAAIVLPGPPGSATPISATPPRRSIMLSAPATQPASLVTSANALDIPVWRLGDLRAERARDFVTSFRADLIVCACFNQKIPAHLIEAMPLGGVNIHPSLLPALRGPDPQFWVLKEGSGRTGVTVHRLARRLDAGTILAQREMAYRDGTTEDDLDRLTARAGAQLLVDILPALHAGSITECPQDEALATYAPFPAPDDFRLDRTRPARAAFNFVRGIAGRGVPILLECDGITYIVRDALDYTEAPRPPSEPAPPARWVRFNPGWALLVLMPAQG